MPEGASSPLLDSLQHIAASLRPAPGVSQADVDASHAVIARALASGQAVSTLASDVWPEMTFARSLQTTRLAGAQRQALTDIAAEAWRNRPAPFIGGGAAGARTATTAVVRNSVLRSHADPLALDAARRHGGHSCVRSLRRRQRRGGLGR